MKHITNLLLATLGVLLVCAVVGCGDDDYHEGYLDGKEAAEKYKEEPPSQFVRIERDFEKRELLAYQDAKWRIEIDGYGEYDYEWSSDSPHKEAYCVVVEGHGFLSLRKPLAKIGSKGELVVHEIGGRRIFFVGNYTVFTATCRIVKNEPPDKTLSRFPAREEPTGWGGIPLRDVGQKEGVRFP